MPRKPDLSLLTKHWLLKLISLIMGASLWYYVVGEDQVDTTITIPLEVRNLPANMVIANPYKKDIEVALRGPRRLIEELRQQHISQPVDLSKTEPGALVIKNDTDAIHLPRGITVQRVQPANTTLLVDRLLKKELPIIPAAKGKPAPGFVLDKLTLKPSQITVTGPQSLLDTVNTLNTGPIHLDQADRSTTQQVHLDLNDTLLKLIGETVIEANIVLKEIMVKKTVRSIPVSMKSTGITGKIFPATVTVEAEIPEQIAHMTPEPAMLFRALVIPLENASGSELPVTVTGVPLPGHSPIVIRNVTPDKVRLLP